MNITVLTGNITKDLELRQTKSGKAWTKFTLAVSRRDDDADFIDCTAWGKTAENMVKYLGKGSKIMLTGRIQTGSYERDGRKIYTTEVVASSVEFLNSRKGGEQAQEDDAVFAAPEEVDDDDLPFG